MNKSNLGNRFFKLLVLSFSLVPIHVWAIPYQRCTPAETATLMHHFSLDKSINNETFPTYSSCLTLNENQKLLAISKPIHIDEDSTDYDLNLFLIDISRHKIIKSYKEMISTTSDAAHFENMQFDINPFSLSNQRKLIGLRYQHGHLGSDSFTIQELKLFEIENNSPIQLVLDKFRTDFEGGTRPNSKCQEALYTKSKVLLIPQKSTSNGLNDFQIKETVYRQDVNEHSCKINKKTTSKTHVIHFDGKKYRYEHLKFLDYGI